MQLDQSYAAPPVLSVTELTQAIKQILEGNFRSVWLQGEISNSKLHSSGHFYFSVKDANAQIAAVMFRVDAQQLKVLPKDGAQVVLRGEMNVYAPSGKYQLTVREMREVGVGALLLKLEELKQKIYKKGWFSKIHKKPLPKFPRRIGVVTSPTGAAIQDILNVLTRRFSGFSLLLNPVKVQGEGAAQEIAKAIDFFNQHQLVDVMIVGRGGGSIEDLWAFNEEIVAEAIFNSKIPIISAVGHETDNCIADYVADVRAPTPSAAAEIVIAEKAHQLHHLAQLQKRMQQTLFHHLRHSRQQLAGILRHPSIASPIMVLGPWMQRLDALREKMDRAIKQDFINKRLKINALQQQIQSLKPGMQIRQFQQRLALLAKSIDQTLSEQIGRKRELVYEKDVQLQQSWKNGQSRRYLQLSAPLKRRQLEQNITRSLILQRERLDVLTASLNAVNPKNLLAKGYCILFSEKDRCAITSIQAVAKDDKLRLALSDGDILTTVTEVFPREQSS